jgi:hypothetical protein
VAGVNRYGQPKTLNNIPIGGYYRGTAHGSTVAGPIWAAAMHAIENLIPAKSFVAPPSPPDQAGVPSVEGQSIPAAQAAIRSAGFTPQLAGVVDSRYTSGTVGAVSLGVDNHTVYIYTSSGHGGVSAPAPKSRPSNVQGNGNGNGGPGNGHGHGHGNGNGNGGRP